MNSFKDIAYQILKEAGKPLHSKEITKIALCKNSLLNIWLERKFCRPGN